MFYPQLVAGPIERPQNLLHQFVEPHKIEYENLTTGLRLMLWGMIKKVVIADRLVHYTDPVFNNPHNYSGIALAIGAVFFAFQIFCDFSGYSDIAIGAARVMGFKLMTNFNKPYHARSISEFWKRWHISLSTWFKDYLYISLGGNRVSVPKMYFNIFIVFLVSGFWHGANWTFIAWGALHGFFSIFALITKEKRKWINDRLGISKIHWVNNTLDVLITFLFVTFAWIFFRANNVRDAFYIIKKIFKIPSELRQVYTSKSWAFLNLLSVTDLILPCFGLIIFLELAHVISTQYQFEKSFSKKPTWFRWTIYYSGLAALLFLGVYENHQFIYFQF